EDDRGLTDMNQGRGWNILLKNKSDHFSADVNLYWGKMWDGRIRPDATPDYGQALSCYEKALKNNPKNLKVWNSIWYVQLNQSDHPDQLSSRIEQTLDSLIKIYPNNEEALNLAFHTYRALVPDMPKAVYYGNRYLNEFPKGAEVATIALMLIYLRENQNPETLMLKLNEFLNSYPDFKDKKYVYQNLLNYYYRMNDRANFYRTLDAMIKIDPEDFSNYSLKARKLAEDTRFDEAEVNIALAFEKCNLLQSRINNPWIDGFARIIQNKIDLAGIYSAQAQIYAYERKFDKSIEARKKAIELGSPFPAYEWEHIGQVYLEMNNLEAAKHAFVASLSISPEQEGALQHLHKIFLTEKNTPTEKFEEYVQALLDNYYKEIQKPMPDFELQSLDQNLIHSSAAKGKILVLYFGATVLWENNRILAELNHLVEGFKNNSNISFWAVSIEGQYKLENYLKDNPFRFQVFYNGDEAMERLQVAGFPTYIVVDENGIERFRQTGELDNIARILEQKIRILLEKTIS
ncbi:redoxin domain-containing protein, partial [candidate division KSB1 bacterium]|nr:redoxin domain-containing protein [candidate division KSB1 bacterium]